MPANKAHTPTINKMLNTADPTIVPTPTSLLDIKTPKMIIERKQSISYVLRRK